ncbi:MAG: hypothetical protein ACJ8FY_07155 [Gemmataceae bacterium]
MQYGVWLNLFRRLPPEHHHNFMVVTTVGTEIAIQNILRIEEEWIILRGRIAGSSDAGRVFYVPYSQINFAGFQKALKEEEYDAIMGKENAPAPLTAQKNASTSLPEALTTPPPSSPTGLTQSGGTVTPDGRPRVAPTRPPIPLKSELLERLRSRSHQAVGNRPETDE